MAEPPVARPSRTLRVGTKVEVRARFDGSWTKGFRVAAIEPEGYRLERSAEGTPLPEVFSFADVRRERTRETWWI